MILNIALDPADPKIKVSKFKMVIRSIHNFFGKLAIPILIAGIIVSGIVYLASTSITNLIILGVYIIMTVFQFLMTERIPKPWGRVFETSTLQPVPLAPISIIDTQYNKVIKTRLTDYEGRFNFLPPEGKYKLQVRKEGYTYPSTQKGRTKGYKNPYYGEEMELGKGQEIVNADVPVDSISTQSDVAESIKEE